MKSLGDIVGKIFNLSGKAYDLIFLGKDEVFNQERYTIKTPPSTKEIFRAKDGYNYRLDLPLILDDKGNVVSGSSADNTDGAWW